MEDVACLRIATLWCVSIEAWYGRVTIEQLRTAIDDRKAARALIDGVLPERQCEPAEARALSIGTTWDAIDYLLECADGPVEIVSGTSFVPYLDGASYLTDDQVRDIANWLATVSFDDLMGSIDPDNPSRPIYKTDLAYPGHQAWIRESYDGLASFFAATARHDEAVVIVWG